MSVILLTYANNKDEPLSQLEEEYREANKVLARWEARSNCKLKSFAYTTIEDIAHYLNEYREELVFFGYSGHAESDMLLTEGGPAQAAGIAQLLGQCPHLEVVFLNGCSTAAQVRGLWKAGVKLVLATHESVNDSLARDFAIHLFKSLEKGQTIEQAYDFAKGLAMTKRKEAPAFEEGNRGILLRRGGDEIWGLFNQNEAVLNWKLPTSPNSHLLNLHLKEHAEEAVPKVLFIADRASTDKVYSKIKNSFRTELQAKQVFFNDLFSISSEINQEGTLSEVEAADAIVFIVNGLEFFNLWEKISWIKEPVQQLGKPVIFIKLSGESQTLDDLAQEVGVPPTILPGYSEMFKNLPPPAWEDYILNGFKGELNSSIHKAVEESGIPAKRLEEELLELDLGPQTENFRKFIAENGVFNLVLIQGTGLCGQNILLRRLKESLPLSNCPPYLIDFNASEGPPKTEAALWKKLSEYMGIDDPDEEEPDRDYIAKTLSKNLKKKDYFILLDNLATAESAGESAQNNLGIITAFWKKALELLPKEGFPYPCKLYIFAINRAGHCGVDFDALELKTDNPNGKLVVIGIDPIDKETFETWHFDKKRRFKEPAFHQLIEKADWIVGDGYFSGVVHRICENLNCIPVYANLEK